MVTGGAGNLAMAASRALLQHGLEGLALLDLESSFESSASSVSQLQKDFAKSKIVCIPVDVTSESEVSKAMRTAYEMLGSRIDILCCFAGIVSCVPSLQASAAEVKQVVDINLMGAFICSQAAAKFMQQDDSGGSIILISSISGHFVNFPQPQCAYNISKAGVVHLARSLAVEWAAFGIRVNSISPGYMDTIINAGNNLQGLRDSWMTRCPMGRLGDPEELTGTIILLASQRAGRFITGANLIVDGGTTCL